MSESITPAPVDVAHGSDPHSAVQRSLTVARRAALQTYFSDGWQALALAQQALASQTDAPETDRVCLQSTTIRIQALSGPQVPLDSVVDLQRLEALHGDGPDPLCAATIAINLAEVVSRLGLHEPAFLAYERARYWLQLAPSCDWQDEVDVGCAYALVRAGMFAKGIELLMPLTTRPLADDLRHMLYSTLGTAHYFLAEQGDSGADVHRQASLRFHALSAKEAERGSAPISRYRCEVNLAIGHARAGQIPQAREHLARLPALVDETWPLTADGASYRARDEQQSWLGYVEALISLAEGRRDEAMQRFQNVLACFRDVEPSTSLGMLQLRAAELLVVTAHESRMHELAYHAQLEVQHLREMRNRQSSELSSRLLSDALSMSRLKAQNEALQAVGHELQDTLAQRNQELTQTLDQLRAEVSIRKATESALQQAHDQLEQRVRERSAQLHQTLQDLAHQERQAAMAHIVVGVAHELNTPLGNAVMALSTIGDAAQQLQKQYSAGQLTRSEMGRFLATLQDSQVLASSALERAADLVQRFKQLSVQQMPERRQRFDPRQLLAQAIEPWENTAASRQVRLVHQLQSCGRVDSCPGALQRILDQLIDNAMSHAFDAQSAAARIDIRFGPQPGSDDLLLCVQDNGRGMDQALQEQVFTPFMTTARGRGHAGLGLHVAQLLCQHRLGGRISITSAPNGGSLVCVLFPRVAPASAEESFSPEPAAEVLTSPTP